MSVTEDAAVRPSPRRSSLRLPGAAGRATPWGWLVGLSAALLAGVAAVLGIWWATSSETRIAEYRLIGTLSTIELDVGDADVEILGGDSGAVEVQRTEETAFGREPRERRTLQAGVVRISSRCPDTVVGTCHARYRLNVRDNLQVNIRTTSGRVRVVGLNGSTRIVTGSGAIAVDGFCGFLLSATSASGAVRGAADCSPDRIELRSSSGNVHAVVPNNRYRVDANSDGGSVRIRNLVTSDDASYAVQAISGSGDVIVDGRR
jgi:Putative adhesin